MRIKLTSSKDFFDELLADNCLSLKKLAKKLDLNYSNIKQYRRGEKTLPESVFENLIKMSKNKEQWISKKTQLPDNWGKSKGGSIAAKLDRKNTRASHARLSRSIPKVKIILDEDFCEFYGVLLGDGCISKFKESRGFTRYGIFITENKKLDSAHLKDLRAKLNKKYNLNSYYYEYKNVNACCLRIYNKELCIALNKNFNVPIGDKYAKLKISSKIMSQPWKIKKFVLRGLFDTDGLIFARKDEDYKYPHIEITSKSPKLLNQIKQMLKDQGYPAYIHGMDVQVKGLQNVKRWFEDIGSSNPRNTARYKFFVKEGFLPPRKSGLFSNG